jgi:hypothetical protein
MGRFLAALIMVCAIGAGFGIYYLQVYAFYDEVAQTGEDVVLTRLDGMQEVIDFDGFEAIDANSSPIRYRACFRTNLPLAEAETMYQSYDDAIPLEAPGWFGCYSADEIGSALETGEAKAFLSVENIVYGVDRIAAIFPDGRGFVWHQINPCGEVVFDGRPAPDGCPTPPNE